MGRLSSNTLVDEFLNVVLARFFFGTKRVFPKLWQAKRFANFNYYVLEPLTLMEKLRFAKAIHDVPKAIAADIDRLNHLRNPLAHAFFPENLRALKPEWKGKDIFSFDGLDAFVEDMGKVAHYFFTHHPPPGARG